MPRKAKTELNLNTETDSKAAVKTKTAAKTLSKTAKTSAKKSASASTTKAQSTASKAKAPAKKSASTTKAAAKVKESSETKSAAKTLSKTAAKNFSKAEGKTLIIVESPSKATTLSGILGSKYIVRSSKGHIRDLPKSRMAIDIEHDFAPEYILVQGKAELKKELIELAAGAKEVLLASDPDREGEAIAWHLADILGVSLNKKCRVRFYEITANAVKNAVKAPDYIDLNKVDAQQARRILDRLVGYTLSPLLWKKVKYGLSAGRVQSVALNLICEREREILKFDPTPYWAISVEAEDLKGKRKYYLKAEKFNKKSLLKNSLPLLINSEEFANEILNEIKNNKLIVKDFTQKNSKREAPAPFRTSTLQQEASRRLSMSPRMTMMVAQSLYEGFN
ncbi:MAG: DNA topoisomerase I, partial [Synergistaceae bacterium]|nr:DNA topoisomerase I [Synergistaceae bacterium]